MRWLGIVIVGSIGSRSSYCSRLNNSYLLTIIYNLGKQCIKYEHIYILITATITTITIIITIITIIITTIIITTIITTIIITTIIIVIYLYMYIYICIFIYE